MNPNPQHPHFQHPHFQHPHPMQPARRPATPVRTILLIAAGIVVFVLVLASALGDGGTSDDSSTGSECTTEFFDGGTMTVCNGEVVSTDVGDF
ncbi:hypothetical protein [Pseudonocardia oceani]|uniref:Uncharacterized protein n=1 Tax=Pseudonocardia oceani TaxID=2792013 RepID=A0ABS6UDL9_9PSEU|nr:hypothetical protein [Pseudonocardia oceani]MBW0129929.1 hypothetical protein [Pseudonocardia oceani]